MGSCRANSSTNPSGARTLPSAGSPPTGQVHSRCRQEPGIRSPAGLRRPDRWSAASVFETHCCADGLSPADSELRSKVLGRRDAQNHRKFHERGWWHLAFASWCIVSSVVRNPVAALTSPRAPNGLKDRVKLGSCERPEARGRRLLSTYFTDEQGRDATQMRDFTTGVKPFGALGEVPRARCLRKSRNNIPSPGQIPGDAYPYHAWPGDGSGRLTWQRFTIPWTFPTKEP
jgi:hypothetical protein